MSALSTAAAVAAPAAVAVATTAVAAAQPIFLNPIETFLGSFNTNPYFIGVMMLMLNFGGRFLGMEISKSQEKFFQQPWVRKILIFIVFFIATRNIFVAAFLTLLTTLLFGILLNENSRFYLGASLTKTGAAPSAESFESGNGSIGGLSVEEKEILNRLSEKQARYSKDKTSNSEKKSAPVEQTYLQNLNLLNGATTSTDGVATTAAPSE